MNTKKTDTCIDRRKALKYLSTAAAVASLPFMQGCDRESIERFRENPYELADQINSYRRDRGLSDAERRPIAISHNLTLVAFWHVCDLTLHEDEIRAMCGSESIQYMHSWSNWRWGPWRGGCSASDWNVMWNKPREITSYTGRGYEITHGNIGASARAIVYGGEGLDGWANSEPHNAVMLNRIYSDPPTRREIDWTPEWNAMGAFYNSRWACAWFGNERDA